MSLLSYLKSQRSSRLLYASAALVLIALVAFGVMASKGWLPKTDPKSGKRTGWFGKDLSQNAASSRSPFAPPLPNPTPQLSKEYIYAGSRLLAVEDSNATAAPPADLAVWRPSTGTWWVMGGPGSQQVTQAWGQPTDKPVPGDYDGDGKTDFSVFRPSTGEWYYVQSSDNAWGPVIAWGTSTDVRVPADFDGDGRTDRAVWRPGDGVWYIVVSSTGASTYQTYGISGDVPAPGDYDGDGRADLAVWRQSNQTFYSRNSSNGADQYVNFSQSNAVPGSSDYDGDGRADYAIRHGSTWTVRKSSDLSIYSTTPVGDMGSDQPVHNDYDGDGKTDVATWRDSNGTWYIRQSASGNSLRQVQWGIPGDIPVPAFYRR